MPKKYKSCIYCMDGIGTTRDHVPPRGMFPANPPKNLIAVPCCEDCRLRDAKHDETVIQLIQSLAVTEIHPVFDSDLKPKRDETWQKFPDRLLKLVAFMEIHDMPRFNFDKPVVNKFFERITRAVAYDAYKIPYAKTLDFRWRGNEPDFPMFEEAPTKSVGDIFSYNLLHTPCYTGIFSRLVFYERFTACCSLTRAVLTK